MYASYASPILQMNQQQTTFSQDEVQLTRGGEVAAAVASVSQLADTFWCTPWYTYQDLFVRSNTLLCIRLCLYGSDPVEKIAVEIAVEKWSKEPETLGIL
jgi:hypothetical protein